MVKRCWIAVFTVGLCAGLASNSEAQLPEHACSVLTQLNRGLRTHDSVWSGTQKQVAGEDCAGGEIYDDGTAESAYSGTPHP